jgi:nucleotide-binding universal stress UspA family protein
MHRKEKGEINMKNILVPIDGSEFSERAILKSKEFAEAFGCKVTLLNVISVLSAINYTTNTRFSMDAVVDWPALVESAKTSSKELLEKAKASLPGIEVETVMMDQPDGAIAKAIADYVKLNDDVDLVIMGSNGIHSLAQRFYLGSVTLKMLHFVTKPILIVQ